MVRRHEDEVVAEAWRSVLRGRCWLAALLMAAGELEEAESQLLAIADRLPVRDAWC